MSYRQPKDLTCVYYILMSKLGFSWMTLLWLLLDLCDLPEENRKQLNDILLKLQQFDEGACLLKKSVNYASFNICI